MKLLVVGHTGYVGSAIASAASMAGYAVAGVGRGDPLPHDHFDAVIDCNGDSRRFWCNENPIASFDVNVRSVADRLESLSFGCYLYLSTIDVYGHDRAYREKSREDGANGHSGLDVYGLHKFLGETLVTNRAAKSLIIRSGTVIGPGLKKNPIYDALNDRTIRMTRDSTLSLVTTDYLSSVVLNLLKLSANGLWNVTGSSSIDVETILDQIANARHRSIADYSWHDTLTSIVYDINTEKLEALWPVPSSEAMLQAYLLDWQSGRQ